MTSQEFQGGRAQISAAFASYDAKAALLAAKLEKAMSLNSLIGG